MLAETLRRLQRAQRPQRRVRGATAPLVHHATRMLALRKEERMAFEVELAGGMKVRAAVSERVMPGTGGRGGAVAQTRTEVVFTVSEPIGGGGARNAEASAEQVTALLALAAEERASRAR
jgi:hypothetical protein